MISLAVLNTIRAKFSQPGFLVGLFFGLALISGPGWMRSLPHHMVLTSDALAYWSAAHWLIHGAHTMPDQLLLNTNLFRAWPYVIFLSGFQALSLPEEPALLLVRYAQTIMYALNIALMVLLACRISKNAITGVLAGIFGLFYLPLLFHTDWILTETLSVTLTLLAWLS